MLWFSVLLHRFRSPRFPCKMRSFLYHNDNDSNCDGNDNSLINYINSSSNNINDNNSKDNDTDTTYYCVNGIS